MITAVQMGMGKICEVERAKVSSWTFPVTDGMEPRKEELR